MQTQLSVAYRQRPEAQEAASLIRKCVHCGFCNATCPTYQVLGDELDGPRGRIYLIKQLLEQGEVSRSTQQHLDRCLTCLNCETTCPSGVQFGSLVEIGRRLVDERVARPPGDRTQRWLLRELLTSKLFAPAFALGQLLRPLLPRVLRDKVPARAASRTRPAPKPQPQQVVMLSGCVQPSMLPGIDRAAVRVLAAAGIEVLFANGTACCGALRTHLSDPLGGLDDMRRNVDAWTPYLAEPGVLAFVSSASACALTLKNYAHALREDPDYAPRAARIAARVQDLSELLPRIVAVLKTRIHADAARRVTFHPPCTLQHGQKLRGVETHLRELGFSVSTPPEANLCCGSAGAYSILEPAISATLRARKLINLAATQPDVIISANVGCIQHLQAGTPLPVRHWIELIDEVL